MGVWGLLLGNENRRFIGKTQLRGLIQANRRTARNGDEFAIEMQALPFDTEIPPAPSDFDSLESLSFALTPKEKQYLHAKLSHLVRNGAKGIAFRKARFRTSDECQRHCELGELLGFKEFSRLAGDDRAQLKIAERAAALVAIGRGVYAALVEQLRNEDHKEDKEFHQTELDLAVAKYWDKKDIELDLEELKAEIPTLPIEMLDVLKNTQAWLNKHKRNPGGPLQSLRGARIRTKEASCSLAKDAQWSQPPRRLGCRNRVGGRERAQTGPLHYRWHIVRNLLGDLDGVLRGDRYIRLNLSDGRISHTRML